MINRVDFSNEFFKVMTSPSSANDKMYTLSQFIERFENDGLDLTNSAFETYFLAFETLVDIDDLSVKKTAFKAYRKLVAKRAMAGSMRSKEAKSIAVICLSNLGDESVVTRCTKIIEDVFDAFTKEFTLVLNEIVLPSGDVKVLRGVLSWLSSPSLFQGTFFEVSHIIATVVNAMNKSFKKSRRDIYKLFSDFLISYFQSEASVHAANKVAYSAVQSSTIDPTVRKDVLSIIEVIPKVPSYAYQSHSASKEPVSLAEYSKLGLRSPFDSQKTTSVGENHEPTPSPVSEIKQESSNSLPEDDETIHLQNFIKKLENYDLEVSQDLQPITDCDSTDLERLRKKYLSFFNGKESELNWSKREGCIRELRKMVRGNIVHDSLDEFRSLIEDFAEPISKAMESLRTVLSSNAAYLIKDMALILKTNFDSLIDMFLQPLINVCMRKKNISAKVAFTVVCAILINCSYSGKYLVKIKAWMDEKRDTTFHTFSAWWLQILVIRFHSTPSLFHKTTSQYTVGPKVPLIHEMLKSLLSDANITVRQAARDAYWSVCYFSPRDKELIFLSLDSKTQKMVERDSPEDITFKGKVPFSHAKDDKPTHYTGSVTSAMGPTLTSVQRSNSTNVSRAPSRTASRNHSLGSRPISRSNSTNAGSSSGSTVSRVRESTPSNVGSHVGNSVQARAASRLSGSITKRGDSRGRISGNEKILEEFRRKKAETADNNRSAPRLNSFEGSDYVPHYARPIKRAEQPKPRQIVDKAVSSGPERERVKEPVFTPVHTDVRNPAESVTSPAPMIIPIHSVPASENPIKDQLMSRDITVIIQGVDALKYALRHDEDSEIPNNIKDLMSGLSKTHIKTLGPLFEYTGTPKIFKVFNASDLLRSYASIFEVASHSFVEEVSEFYDVPAVYNGINEVLAECSQVLNSTKLKHLEGKHHAAFTNIVIKFVLNYLQLDINNFTTDTYFPVISQNFFQVYKRSGRSLALFVDLFKQLHQKIPSTLSFCLSQFDPNSEIPLRKIIEDSVPSTYPFDDDEFGETSEGDLDNEILDSGEIDLHELTVALAAGDASEERRYSAGLSDPELPLSQASHDSPFVSNSPPNITNESEETPSQPTAMEVDEIEPKSSSSSDDVTGAKIDSRASGNVLAADFSHIDIMGHKELQIKDPYQTLVEKVDPLKAKAERGKQISIFQDDDTSGDSQDTASAYSSSTVIVDYNYTELNWFNFELAHHPKKSANSFSIVEFETLTEKLGDCLVNNDEVLTLVNYLQNSVDFNIEFASYFQKQGRVMVENNLWKYLRMVKSEVANGCEVNKSHISNGLIITKQLLICNVPLDFNKLLKTLIKISNMKDERTSMEVNYAIKEIFDEVFKRHQQKSELFQTIVEVIDNFEAEEPKPRVFISFEIFLKLLNTNTIIFDEHNLKAFIHNKLQGYLVHESVDIRRLVVLIYGKFIIHIKQNKTAVDDITNGLSTFQRKLIDYYSKF